VLAARGGARERDEWLRALNAAIAAADEDEEEEEVRLSSSSVKKNVTRGDMEAWGAGCAGGEHGAGSAEWTKRRRRGGSGGGKYDPSGLAHSPNHPGTGVTLRTAAAPAREPPLWSDGRAPSAALGRDTRAALADVSNMAAALKAEADDNDNDEDEDDEREQEQEGDEDDDDVMHPGLGLTTHFLFNFTVEAIRYQRGTTTAAAKKTSRTSRAGAGEDASTSSSSSATSSSPLLLHVDVERKVIEAYAMRRGRGRGEGYAAGAGAGAGATLVAPLRQTLVRILDMADVGVVGGAAADESRGGGRRVALTAVTRGRRREEIGCFEFQSCADRAVFEAVVADLRAGVYQSADRYQRRALLKRGPEGGGGWNIKPSNRPAGGGTLNPASQSRSRSARFLALVPGKLLVMQTNKAAVPLAALSLGEGVRVGVRASAGAGAGGYGGGGGERGGGGEGRGGGGGGAMGKQSEEAPRLALLEVTVRGRRHVFKMPSIAAAREWHKVGLYNCSIQLTHSLKPPGFGFQPLNL
jgi:hypothetical protein